MSYDALRQFADSWGLVLMGVAFVILIGWTFRRNAHVHHRHAAHSIFENEDRSDG